MAKDRRLTEHEKDEIRHEYHVNGTPTWKLALMYDVSESTIVKVVGKY